MEDRSPPNASVSPRPTRSSEGEFSRVQDNDINISANGDTKQSNKFVRLSSELLDSLPESRVDPVVEVPIVVVTTTTSTTVKTPGSNATNNNKRDVLLPEGDVANGTRVVHKSPVTVTLVSSADHRMINARSTGAEESFRDESTPGNGDVGDETSDLIISGGRRPTQTSLLPEDHPRPIPRSRSPSVGTEPSKQGRFSPLNTGGGCATTTTNYWNGLKRISKQQPTAATTGVIGDGGGGGGLFVTSTSTTTTPDPNRIVVKVPPKPPVKTAASVAAAANLARQRKEQQQQQQQRERDQPVLHRHHHRAHEKQQQEQQGRHNKKKMAPQPPKRTEASKQAVGAWNLCAGKRRNAKSSSNKAQIAPEPPVDHQIIEYSEEYTEISMEEDELDDEDDNNEENNVNLIEEHVAKKKLSPKSVPVERRRHDFSPSRVSVATQVSESCSEEEEDEGDAVETNKSATLPRNFAERFKLSSPRASAQPPPAPATAASALTQLDAKSAAFARKSAGSSTLSPVRLTAFKTTSFEKINFLKAPVMSVADGDSAGNGFTSTHLVRSAGGGGGGGAGLKNGGGEDNDNDDDDNKGSSFLMSRLGRKSWDAAGGEGRFFDAKTSGTRLLSVPTTPAVNGNKSGGGNINKPPSSPVRVFPISTSPKPPATAADTSSDRGRPTSSISKMPSSSSSRRVDEPVPVVTQQRSRSASLQPARLSALLHGGSNPSTSTNHTSSSSSGICATSGSLRNPPPEKRAAESSHFVIVAVDFGTTYSGYAFCFTHKPSDIHVMRKWPGDPDLSNQKTRTALLLKPNGDFDSFGFVARDRYHDLKPNEASRYFFFEKFKMILHHDMSLSRDTEIMAVNGKTLPAAVVFRHALQFFRDHALAEIGEGCGLDAGLNEEDVRWVLTVPAIWRQPAKQLMREAAYKAGMASADQPQRLLIALEPEAAAIYCRKLKFWDLKDRSPAMSTHTWHGNTCFTEYVIKELEKGTTYMVVDCGGGTVDITVHEIMDAEGNMKEIQKASGDACGSIEVDKAFEKLLEQVFGEAELKRWKTKHPSAYVHLLATFETKKRYARPTKQDPANVSLPLAFITFFESSKKGAVEEAIQRCGIPGVSWTEQGMIRLGPQKMQELFKPALEQLSQLVENVFRSFKERKINYLFLVGGFAESPLLQERIKKEFQDRTKVIIPNDPAVVILKGASMFGVDPSVVRVRRARMTYGVGVLQPFNVDMHPLEKKVRQGDVDWCADCFDKFVVEDDSVQLGDVVLRRYTPARPDQTTLVMHIYSSKRSDAEFTTDTGVRKCGSLQLELAQSRLDVAYSKNPIREVQVRMVLGDTEIRASALDLATGLHVKTNIDFLAY